MLGSGAEVTSGVDQPDVAECLRGVPELALGHGVVLLAEQAEVVAQGEQPFEQRLRLAGSPDAVQRVSKPERARQENTLRAGQPVDSAIGRRLVAQHEAVLAQLPL